MPNPLIEAKNIPGVYQVPFKVYAVSLLSIQFGVAISLSDGMIKGLLFDSCLSGAYFILNMVNLAFVWARRITHGGGLVALLLIGVIELQIRIIFCMSTSIQASLAEVFYEALVMAFFALAMVLYSNRAVGISVVLLACADIVAVNLHRPGGWMPQYNLILPLVIIAFAISASYFRDSLDEAMLKLYGERGIKPELDLNARGITPAEWRCINYHLRFLSTKEMA